MILIKNGRVIDNNTLVKKDILIDNDVIIDINDHIDCDCDIIDAKNNLVIPGGIDVHVHFREPGFAHKETIKTGSKSAAKGGITTVMPMPNLNPVPDNLEHLEKELEIIKRDAIVNCYPYASVTVNEEDKVISDIDSLYSRVLAITDDGRGVNNLDILENACRLAKKYNLVIASHAEDNVYKYAPQGEYIAVRREIEIAKRVGCKYHFCHMSTKESFEAIRLAQKEGYPITCEVAPHHLILNEDMIKDANWKMNPPLRSEENRIETIKALLDGTACMVASDHAPHSEEEKSKEYDKCPNGIIGLETMIPIIITHFVKKGLISWDRFLDLLVNNPIKVFNLPKRKLSVGYKADIAIIDIDNKRKYTKEEILSKGKNSPFIGMEFYGFTICTLVNGKVVYSRKENV